MGRRLEIQRWTTLATAVGKISIRRTNMGFLKGKKTYVTAALTIIGAVAAFATGDATAIQAIQMGVTALLAAFIRNGMR